MVPIVKGTRGFNQTANRIGTGQVELTLDVPMAPNEYAVSASITEPLLADTTILTQKSYSGGVSKITVSTFVGGAPADVDFDVNVARFAQFGLQ
jgi:hypothetical protein